MCLAVPGKVIEVKGEDIARKGVVDFGGTKREVGLAFVPDVKIGDWVLIHAGLALNAIDEDEAERTLAELKELEEANKDAWNREK